jgi:hypothetical protein
MSGTNSEPSRRFHHAAILCWRSTRIMRVTGSKGTKPGLAGRRTTGSLRGEPASSPRCTARSSQSNN